MSTTINARIEVTKKRTAVVVLNSQYSVKGWSCEKVSIEKLWSHPSEGYHIRTRYRNSCPDIKPLTESLSEYESRKKESKYRLEFL